MIPADLTAEIARALRAAAAAGELPEAATVLTAAGTWRPYAAGGYSTSLPLGVVARFPADPRAIARRLADRLRPLPWISGATVTGPGYLTITVTTDHLAGVAARTAEAGAAAPRSDALGGSRLAAPDLPDLAAAADWPSVWRAQRAALTGRIAEAAGATVMPAGAAEVRPAVGPVAAAVAFRGIDAVRYALARTARPDAAAIERGLSLRLDLANPFVAVRYAHAYAASVGRWATDLGLAQPGPAAQLKPEELALLAAMSWLAERTAAAARRRRPAELAAYLEDLATAWLHCAARCPALPFLGRAAPAEPGFRLVLAAGARAALGAGLGLLGVAAPERA